ncbi:MAG: gluconeogenesis factor YvcK family protein [Pseudanabaenaceae cyanobacterium]
MKRTPSGFWKWLRPGLVVKRWVLLGVVGTLLLLLGITILAGLTPVFFLIRGLNFLGTVLPRSVSGPIAIALGLLLLAWSQRRVVGTIAEALAPEGKEGLVDLLLDRRRLQRGPRLVAIGGGTGLSGLLRGLKRYSTNITAIVTVADDGGSSGRLRREHGVLPPGDIRNCLAALADEEKLLTELFQYRFTAGEGLSGHSFGNLFLTAMAEITGNLETAIAASSQVLAVRGRVLPATLDDMVLLAELEDGRKIQGESNITAAGGKIVRLSCLPERPRALPQALRDLADADLITLGPGSLYTSILPNLLVPELVAALIQRRAPCIYICNIMSQPGETQGYTVGDHVRALDATAGHRLFDLVLVQKYAPSQQALRHYRDSHFVEVKPEEMAALRCPYLLADVLEEWPDGRVRHNPEKLAGVLLRWYNRNR